MPLLKNPAAKWDGVAVCTHGKGNHAVRDARWRYIRYADGSEELYDHSKDPYEWTNLAAEAGMDEIKSKLAAALPKEEVKPTAAGKKKGEGKAKKKAAVE